MLPGRRDFQPGDAPRRAPLQERHTLVGQRAAPQLEWLLRQLWASEPQRGRVGFTSPAEAGSSRASVSYAVVPSVTRPKFILPLDGGVELVSAILHRHLGMRSPGTAAARAALAMAVGTPAGRWLLRNTFSVEAAPGAPLLEQLLAEIFEVPDVVIATGVPGLRPNRKPVLQVYDRDGRSIGFVKLGWNSYSDGLVATESAALEQWNGQIGPQIRTPKALWSGEWNGHRVLATLPIPDRARRVSKRTTRQSWRAARQIASVHGESRETLIDSAYWQRLQADLAPSAARSPDVARFLEKLQAVGATDLTFAAWHGDWVPWNLAELGDELWILDWEHHSTGVPLGYDLVHHEFQAHVLGRRTSAAPEALWRSVSSTPMLDQFGVDGREARLTMLLYLAEIYARAERALAGGSGEAAALSRLLSRTLDWLSKCDFDEIVDGRRRG